MCLYESRGLFWRSLVKDLGKVLFLLRLTQQADSEKENSIFFLELSLHPAAQPNRGKTSPVAAHPVPGSALSLLLASETCLNAFPQNSIMPGNTQKQTKHHPTPHKSFSMGESQHLHTLFITLHLLGKQPNLAALPQDPRAEKLIAWISRLGTWWTSTPAAWAETGTSWAAHPCVWSRTLSPPSLPGLSSLHSGLRVWSPTVASPIPCPPFLCNQHPKAFTATVPLFLHDRQTYLWPDLPSTLEELPVWKFPRGSECYHPRKETSVPTSRTTGVTTE